MVINEDGKLYHTHWPQGHFVAVGSAEVMERAAVSSLLSLMLYAKHYL